MHLPALNIYMIQRKKHAAPYDNCNWFLSSSCANKVKPQQNTPSAANSPSQCTCLYDFCRYRHEQIQFISYSSHFRETAVIQIAQWSVFPHFTRHTFTDGRMLVVATTYRYTYLQEPGLFSLIAIRAQTERPRTVVWFPVEAWHFSFLCGVQTGSVAHLAFCLRFAGGSFFGGREANEFHLLLSWRILPNKN
jgi:hypothetical protein